MVFTKLLLQNILAIRPYKYEAASELLLPEVTHCIPVVSLRCIGKCAVLVLKRSDYTLKCLSRFPLQINHSIIELTAMLQKLLTKI